MSCLFNSISHFIQNTSGPNVRYQICEYLSENKVVISGIDTHELLEIIEKNYINNMKQLSKWGGGIEIQTACNIWNLCIVVLDIRKDEHISIVFKPIDPNTNIENSKIHITWNGFHYEPIEEHIHTT